jgi:putative addiction module antidote
MGEPKIEHEGGVLQVRKIGNSLGLILPKELLARPNLTEGDKLHIIEQPERGLHLTPYDPVHVKGMELSRKAFKTYANTFRELAK